MKYYFFVQYKNEQKALKFDNVELKKEEFHTSKQPIALNLVNVNIVIQVVNISSATKIIISLYCNVLFYLILGDT